MDHSQYKTRALDVARSIAQIVMQNNPVEILTHLCPLFEKRDMKEEIFVLSNAIILKMKPEFLTLDNQKQMKPFLKQAVEFARSGDTAGRYEEEKLRVQLTYQGIFGPPTALPVMAHVLSAASTSTNFEKSMALGLLLQKNPKAEIDLSSFSQEVISGALKIGRAHV